MTLPPEAHVRALVIDTYVALAHLPEPWADQLRRVWSTVRRGHREGRLSTRVLVDTSREIRHAAYVECGHA